MFTLHTPTHTTKHVFDVGLIILQNTRPLVFTTLQVSLKYLLVEQQSVRESAIIGQNTAEELPLLSSSLEAAAAAAETS